MKTSVINLNIEVTHEKNLPFDPQEMAKAIAVAVGQQVEGLDTDNSYVWGRRIIIGTEDQQNVQVYIQSAAFTFVQVFEEPEDDPRPSEPGGTSVWVGGAPL